MNNTDIKKLNLNIGEGYSEKFKILKEIFPELIEDNKISFNKIREIFLNDIDFENRFQLMWSGKENCFQTIQNGTTKTLKPEIDKSLNWDNSKNIFIEGNNLEALQILQKSYYNSIKLIYIDPPYNTGNDFVYNDTFESSKKEYIENSDEKFVSNPKSSGRFHSDWLNMIYPRLFLARNLLKNDGVIAVSIADEEIHHLRNVMDEIFGEENFRNTILLRRYDKNLNTQFVDKGLKTLNVGAEYVVIYSKSDKFNFSPVYREASDDRQKNGYWKSFWNDADRPTMRYDILGFTPSEGQWKWKKETAVEAVDNYKVYLNNFSNKKTLEEYWYETGKIKKFIRKRENLTGKNSGVEHWIPPSEGILRSSNWTDILASESLSSLDLSFSSPKNTNFLKELITLCDVKDDEYVLDFFAGSGSTGHAIYELNKNNKTNINFILVQLDEKIDDENFNNISEITRERLKRISSKLNVDFGFKSYKIINSNFKIWNGDLSEYDLFQSLENSINNIDNDAIQFDILNEIMIKSGFALTVKIEEFEIDSKKIFSLENNSLIICLEIQLNEVIIREIAKLEPARVVVLDSGFNQKDDLKANAVQIMKSFGIEDFRTV